MDPETLSRNISNASNIFFEYELMAVKSYCGRLFYVFIFSFTAILAFIGNCAVILVEFFGKRTAKNLRKYLINLAFSDLLIGVFSVPFVYTDFMYGEWIFPNWLCPFSQFIQIISVFVTAFTLTIIGIERFAATLYPFSASNRWLKRKGNLVLGIGWLLAIVLGIYPLIYTKVRSFDYNEKVYYDCKLQDDSSTNTIIYTAINFLSTFLIPIIIMIATYGTITVKLFYYNSPQQTNHRINKIKIHVFKIFLCVVVIFFICWFPIKIYILLFFWLQIADIDESTLYFTLFIHGFLIFYLLAMINSMINPLIYCFMSRSFRADMFDLIINCCQKIIGYKSETLTGLN